MQALRTGLKPELQEDPQVYDLLAYYLACDAYRPPLVAQLLRVARGQTGASWQVRCLAVLMVQHQAMRIPLEDTATFIALLEELHLVVPDEDPPRVKASVLKEGFSTTDIPGFIVELRRKMGRLDRIYGLIQGEATGPEALETFIRFAHAECKLVLARYLFSPGEVAGQAMRHMKTSRGVSNPLAMQHGCFDDEVLHTRIQLPPYESRILDAFCEAARIYWVASNTPSTLNALVEYPLKTVVLVVKPPGSEIELEIKRAGRRGAVPLNVVFSRNGRPVSPSHRFDGGSMSRSLRWEAGAGALYSRVFRRAHQVDAPVSQVLTVTSIYDVPVDGGEEHIVDFFTHHREGSPWHHQMRAAMQQCVSAFEREQDEEAPALDGSVGLTANFLNFISPGQAILVHTSSFRLDTLDAYLSRCPDAVCGPELYFTNRLQVPYDAKDERRLADELLDEVLSVYTPPSGPYPGYEAYLAAAFAVPENRARADRNYCAAMRQAATFWGTLLAMRGYSHGESVVARNVGLRTVWQDGQWQVKLLFLDHDNLHIIGREAEAFHPHLWLPAASGDDHFLVGKPWRATNAIKSSVRTLESIYRVDGILWQKGHTIFEEALKRAYDRTKHALLYDAQVRSLFSDRFLERLLDWDQCVRMFLDAPDTSAGVAHWKTTVRAFLKGRTYREELIEEHLEGIESFKIFLRRYAFLFSLP